MREETRNVIKKPDGNYTVVPNMVIYDKGLSAKAKGIFVYLLSRPCEWSFYMKEIEKNFTDGRASIRSAIKELEALGYVKRVMRGDLGGGTYYEWRISPSAKIEHCTKDENRPLVSTESILLSNIISKDNNNTNSKPKTKRFKKPTVAEVKTYCSERGNNIDADQFVDFYESKGWKVGKSAMKSWEASVRTWERSNGGTNQKPQIEKPMGLR